MATGGGSAPPGTPSPVAQARQQRWRGQQYADITKLRELAARHDRAAARAQQRSSRINVKVEKLRHQATVLREKSQQVLADVPTLEQQVQQYERDADAATQRAAHGGAGSDVTSLHYRIRKLQQKIVDKQQRSRTLELHAATKTQRAAELKVKGDRFNEEFRVNEQEANAYRQRADRLQMVSEAEAADRTKASSPSANAPGDPPGTL